MPQRLRFLLEGPPPAQPYEHATGLRAAALNWVRAADPSLSRELHDANQTKPLVISPLRPCCESEPGDCGFDIAVLADEVAQPLWEGILRSPDSLRLGRTVYHVHKVEKVDEVTWEDLIAVPKAVPVEFEFHLLSPTAHHAPGEFRKSIVLPDPALYFGSWLGRWNLCSPWQIGAGLRELVGAQLAVTACEGGTQVARLDRQRTFIGFQGSVRFTLLKQELAPEGAAVALLALARFASYCGTGVDTMRGMGQTRFLERG